MADQSDVEAELAALVTSIIYPQGNAAPAAVGGLVRIYRGWPNQAALNSDLAAGTINVTVFPDHGQYRLTTRHIDPPEPQTTVIPTLTVNVAGNGATFGGLAGVGQLVGILVDNTAFVHRTAPGDSPALVAAILASYIRTVRIAQVNDATLTVPGARLLIGRVVADQIVQSEIRRQQQGFRISLWCPNPALRDAIAALVDIGLSSQTFMPLPDGTFGRLRQTGTSVFDQSQNANLYRRDLLFSVEYATTLSTTLPALIFGDSRILPDGLAIQSLLA